MEKRLSMPYSLKKLLLCLSFIMIAPFLPCQEAGRKPNILIFSQSDSKDNSEKNLNIINTTAFEEFHQEGLKIIQIEDDVSIDELLDNAGWFGAFFIIEALHKETEIESSLEVNCYSAWNKQLLISILWNGQIYGPADIPIRKALKKLIPVIKTNLEIIKAQPPPGWNIWQEDDKSEPSLPIEVNQEELEIPVILETEQEGTVTTGSDKTINRLFINISAAPLLETGEATQYFTLGSSLSLSGGYRLHTTPAYLTIGGRLGWDKFEAKGILAETKNNMIYAGPELRAGLEVPYLKGIFVRCSAGISWFTLDSTQKGFSYSTIPFLSFGLGGEYSVFHNIGISLSIDYTMHREESILFSGFSPAMGVSYYYK